MLIADHAADEIEGPRRDAEIAEFDAAWRVRDGLLVRLRLTVKRRIAMGSFNSQPIGVLVTLDHGLLVRLRLTVKRRIALGSFNSQPIGVLVTLAHGPRTYIG